MLYKTATVTGDKETFRASLATQIIDVDYPYGGLADDADMKAFRQGDGAAVLER